MALVVDTAPSMELWRPEVADVRSTLEQLVDSVTVWELDTDVSGSVRLRSPGGGLVDPAEFTGQVVVVLTDGVADAWFDGRAASTLATWAIRLPTTVINVLPKRLWPRSGLRPVPGSLRYGNRRANDNWSWQPRHPVPVPAPGDEIPVPVIPARPQRIRTWLSSLTTDNGYLSTSCVLVSAWVKRHRPVQRSESASTEDRLQRFRANASPVAWELACQLAAVPLTVPAMRMVQVGVPGAGPAHLAEVVLGGLLIREHSGAYEFRPGVREALFGTLRDEDVLRIRRMDVTVLATAMARLASVTFAMLDEESVRLRTAPMVLAPLLAESPVGAEGMSLAAEAIAYADPVRLPGDRDVFRDGAALVDHVAGRSVVLSRLLDMGETERQAWRRWLTGCCEVFVRQVAVLVGQVDQFVAAEHRYRNGTRYWPISYTVERTIVDSTATRTGVGQLAVTPRVFLRAGAGAGKTVLLRWLWRTMARHTGVDQPCFIVSVADFAERDFPRLRDLVDPPANGWVEWVFRAGRARLLVDGLDELVPRRRAMALDWLARVMDTYPHARYVLATRPHAIDPKWLDRLGFTMFDLRPMTAEDVLWMVRSRHPGTVGETAATLLADPGELQDMVRESPVLGEAVCSVVESGSSRPTVPELYQAMLDFLLDRHGVGADERTSLRRLAYRTVGRGEITFADAVRLTEAEPDDVALLLDRAPVLTRTSSDTWEFTFPGFGAALEARENVATGQFEQLAALALAPQNHQRVFLAAVIASPTERIELLRQLLDVAPTLSTFRELGSIGVVDLVAGLILRMTPDGISAALRDDIEARVYERVHPRDTRESEALAMVGDAVLDLLPDPHQLSGQQLGLVVRALADIGSPAARAKITQFATVNEPVVIAELLRGLRYSRDFPAYTRDVLGAVDFRDRTVEVRDGDMVLALPYIRGLTRLRCMGELPLNNTGLLPDLQELEVRGNPLLRDVGFLANFPSLTTLSLRTCIHLRDLSALARSQVSDLTLMGVDNVDLRTLRGAPLRGLRIGHRALAEGLSVIPDDLPLERLIIENRPGVPLTGIERWADLETVVVNTEPDDSDRPSPPPTAPPDLPRPPRGEVPWLIEDPATSPHLPRPSYLDESLEEFERNRREP
ncbi:MAG TPA: SAV_2336 N-terminal domain-related protein [Pseudonocardiaceae bacterium]|nr:SAV_2336 N-terminal domain-related protein [Pseudonocardiaceae bacterium]